MEKTIKAWPVTAQKVIDQYPDGVILFYPDGLVIAINKSFSHLTGFKKLHFHKNSSFLKKSKYHKESFYKNIWRSVRRKGTWKGEIWVRHSKGNEELRWLQIKPIRNNKKKIISFIGIFSVYLKHKKNKDNTTPQSHLDTLTGLPNHIFFRERLKLGIASAKKQRRALGVIVVNLDRIKFVNDVYGHSAGDQLIKQAAARIKECLDRDDSVARLGGDEFLILLESIVSEEDASRRAQKIIQKLSPPFRMGSQQLYSSASIGISTFPQNGRDSETLLKCANIAMSNAKLSGRNNSRSFDDSMKDEFHDQLYLAHSLRQAMDNNEFFLHYQPQIDLRTGVIIGTEALLRWKHPKWGFIPPSKFIRWAEDSGFILQLGTWVLEKACQQNRKWQKKGLEHLLISVNLSAIQFKDESLAPTVERILEETGLPPECLDLELTESVVMENVGLPLRTPHDLKAMGVRFSIDDFGTGYSSFSYLKHFPVHTIKMDRSFIKDLSTCDEDRAIAAAIISLGHGLKLSVLAEGVETESQRDILKGLHCDKMQGFLFSQPLPPKEVEKLLRKHPEYPEHTLFHKTFY